MARKQQPQRFEVTGRGAFPMDMLRYDACYPASEADAGVLQRVTTGRSREEATVALVSLRAPTQERWASFGWRVTA